MTHPNAPLGYLITFTTYGERLHGDERGSVERLRGAEAGVRELPPDQAREGRERRALVSDPIKLERAAREVVAEAVRRVCDHNQWHLHALNVRSNHVHAVVSGSAAPERMMNAFKAWATRRLREDGLASPEQKIWARHGSTRYLWTEQDVRDAATYVLDGQGPDLGGTRWTPET